MCVWCQSAFGTFTFEKSTLTLLVYSFDLNGKPERPKAFFFL